MEGTCDIIFESLTESFSKGEGKGVLSSGTAIHQLHSSFNSTLFNVLESDIRCVRSEGIFVDLVQLQDRANEVEIVLISLLQGCGIHSVSKPA